MWTAFIQMGRGTSAFVNMTKFQFHDVHGIAVQLDKNLQPPSRKLQKNFVRKSVVMQNITSARRWTNPGQQVGAATNIRTVVPSRLLDFGMTLRFFGKYVQPCLNKHCTFIRCLLSQSGPKHQWRQCHSRLTFSRVHMLLSVPVLNYKLRNWMYQIA